MLREEFSRKHFQLKFHRVDVFCTAQWRWHPAVFLVYRMLMPAYTIFAFIQLLVVTKPSIRILAFLTIWTYLLEMAFFLTGAMLAVLHWRNPRLGQTHGDTSDRGWQQQNDAFSAGDGEPVRSTRVSMSESTRLVTRGGEAGGRVGADEDIQRGGSDNCLQVGSSLPWYVKVHWALANIIQVFAPIVTVIYFGVLYPSMRDEIGNVNMYDINVHGISTAMVLIDIAVSARPVRLLHALCPILYGVIYVIFSVIFWAADPANNVLYPNVLDWNHPGISIGVVLGLAVLGVPLLQLVNFGLYRLRLKLFRRIYGEPYF